MKFRIVVLCGALLLALSVAYSLVTEIYFDDCGLSEAQAKDAVIREINSLKLDKKYLSSSSGQAGSCSYSFDFEGQGKKINYVVMSTWLHGVKVTSWDYHREALEDANAASQQKLDGAAK